MCTIHLFIENSAKCHQTIKLSTRMHVMREVWELVCISISGIADISALGHYNTSPVDVLKLVWVQVIYMSKVTGVMSRGIMNKDGKVK